MRNDNETDGLTYRHSLVMVKLKVSLSGVPFFSIVSFNDTLSSVALT